MVFLEQREKSLYTDVQDSKGTRWKKSQLPFKALNLTSYFHSSNGINSNTIFYLLLEFLEKNYSRANKNSLFGLKRTNVITT